MPSGLDVTRAACAPKVAAAAGYRGPQHPREPVGGERVK